MSTRRRAVARAPFGAEAHTPRRYNIVYSFSRDRADGYYFYLRSQLIRLGTWINHGDRSEWSDEQILLAYRGQSEVEEAFRQLKDDEHMALRPQYHWTDQKIHVHTFCCLLALLLGRVVEFQARQLHYTEGLSGLLDLLATVRLAMVLKPAGKHGGRPRCGWALEHTAPDAMHLFRHLVPAQPPFVYT